MRILVVLGSPHRHGSTNALADEFMRGAREAELHCGYAGHPFDACLELGITSVYRITLDEITGKRTLPEYWKQAGTGTPYFGEYRHAHPFIDILNVTGRLRIQA